MPYVAYHVNIFGVSEASYELQAKNDDAARTEALQFLKLHPSVEGWPTVGCAVQPRWGAPPARSLSHFCPSGCARSVVRSLS